MKRFRGLLLLLATTVCFGATTYTTRAGIPKPADGDTDWGTTIRAAYDVIDSSMCVQGLANTFTEANEFDGAVTMGNGNSVVFLSASGGATGGNIRNSASLGHTLSMTFGVLDGLFINGNYFTSNADVNIFAGTGHSYGSFAVVGSSADASTAYSGFKATSPISASTLWSLPTADALVAGSPMTSDAAGNLSFRNAMKVSSATVSGQFLVGGTQVNSGLLQINGGNSTGLALNNDDASAGSSLLNRGIAAQSLINLEATYGVIIRGSNGAGAYTAIFSTQAVTNPSTINYQVTVSTNGALGLTNFTAAQIKAQKPTRVGEYFYCSDCATVSTCVSTGTAVNQWALITAKASACQ